MPRLHKSILEPSEGGPINAYCETCDTLMAGEEPEEDEGNSDPV